MLLLYSCGYPDIDTVPSFKNLELTNEELFDLCQLSSNDKKLAITTIALCAVVIEKHIALDNQKKGLDIKFYYQAQILWSHLHLE